MKSIFSFLLMTVFANAENGLLRGVPRRATPEECPDGSMSQCGEIHPLVLSNPPPGKDAWVIANAGGVNNAGGGGLSGVKCQDLHPYCDTCTPGFKACATCEDSSLEGGYAFTNVEGECFVVLNFDDLAEDVWVEAPIPEGYMGLEYSTSTWVMNTENYWSQDSGYANGDTSPPMILFTGYEDPVTMTAPEGFTLSVKSMNLTPAWNNNLQVLIDGFDETLEIVASITVELPTPSDPQSIMLDGFDNLKAIMLTPSGGTNAVPEGEGSHLVMDDMVFRLMIL